MKQTFKLASTLIFCGVFASFILFIYFYLSGQVETSYASAAIVAYTGETVEIDENEQHILEHLAEKHKTKDGQEMCIKVQYLNVIEQGIPKQTTYLFYQSR